MRQFRFGETFGVLVAVDVLIAAFRWWRGNGEMSVVFGFLAGMIGSAVLAGLISAAERRG